MCFMWSVISYINAVWRGVVPGMVAPVGRVPGVRHRCAAGLAGMGIRKEDGVLDLILFISALLEGLPGLTRQQRLYASRRYVPSYQ